jgi:GT2 family glycosyltransferase
LEWSPIIRAILPSIIAFSPEATIYIADNASTDESIAFVQQHYPAIKIKNNANFGFAQDIMKH